MAAEGHLSHVAATCDTALGYLTEVQRVMATGRGGDGTAYQALPDDQRERSLVAVRLAIATLEQLSAALAPEAAGRRRGVRSQASARMWLSTLLYMVRDELRDLTPERLATRYGSRDDATAAVLCDVLPVALAQIDEALEALR